MTTNTADTITSKQRYHIYNDPTICPRPQFLNDIANEPTLKSSDGFVVNDIDSTFRNYKNKNVMMVEYKANERWLTLSQHQLLTYFDTFKDLKDDFLGCYVIQHQHLSTKDGWTKIFSYNTEEQHWNEVYSGSLDGKNWKFYENDTLPAEASCSIYHFNHESVISFIRKKVM